MDIPAVNSTAECAYQQDIVKEIMEMQISNLI